MNKYLLCAAGALLILLLAACAPNPDQAAIQRVVMESEHAAENALSGNGTVADVEAYFATEVESGVADPSITKHIAYSGVLSNHPDATVRLSNFQIDSIMLFPDYNQGRAMYHMDVTVVHDGVPQTATITQSLLLVNTLDRGWRIASANFPDTKSGDSTTLGFFSNLAGQ